jgi:hypothetical protein
MDIIPKSGSLPEGNTSSSDDASSAADHTSQSSATLDRAQLTPWWGKISTLWLWLIPVIVALATLTQTLAPHDFWWHAAVGRLIAQSGRIPTTNMFSWPLPAEHPYLYQNWGAQWLLFQVLERTGLTGMVILRSLCAVVGYALIINAAWRRVRRAMPEFPEIRAARLVALSGLAALGMTVMNLDARPQMFGLPLFGLTVWILFEWPYRAELQMRPGESSGHASASNTTPNSIENMPPNSRERDHQWRWGIGVLIFGLTVIWANLHGSFFLAILLFGAAFTGELLTGTLSRFTRRHFFGAPLEHKAIMALGGIAAGCVVAAVFNPRGFALYAYVAKLSTYRTIQQHIVEWQPPSLDDSTGIAFFGSTLLFAAIAFLTALRAGAETSESLQRYGICGVRAGELLVLLALFVMGCRNLRSILWFALFFVPVAAASGAFYLSRVSERNTQRARAIESRSSPRLNAALLAAMCLVVVTMLPQCKVYWPWTADFRARFSPNPPEFRRDPALILDKTTPVEAAEFLRANPPKGRLWNDMGSGSYLVWALWPSIRLGSDPRIEMFPDAFWQRYRKLSKGPTDAIAQIDAMGVTDILCDDSAQKTLVAHLRKAHAWKEVDFETGTARLFRRIPIVPRETFLNKNSA